MTKMEIGHPEGIFGGVIAKWGTIEKGIEKRTTYRRVGKN